MARAHTAHWAMDAGGATRMSQEAFDLAQSLSIEEFIGPALALRSLASSMDGNMDTSLVTELGVRALAKWTPGTHQAKLALCLDPLATGWYWTGEYERALEYGEQAISLAEEIGEDCRLVAPNGVRPRAHPDRNGPARGAPAKVRGGHRPRT